MFMMPDELSLEFARFVQRKQGRSTVMSLWNEFRPGEDPPEFVNKLLEYYPGTERIATLLVGLYAVTGSKRI
jgi:hypothetical protein